MLAVCVTGDGFSGGGGVPTYTVTSSGLTFASEIKQGAADHAVVQWFTVVIGAGQDVSRTVSVTTTNSSDVGGVKVFVITGYDTADPVHMVGGAHGSTTNAITPTLFTTTNAGCLVMYGAGSWIGGSLQLTSTDSFEEYNDADMSYIVAWKATAQAAGAIVGSLDQEAAGAAKWTWAAIAINSAPESGGQEATVTQVAEADTATALVEKKLKAVAQGSETDTATSLVENKRRILGQPAKLTRRPPWQSESSRSSPRHPRRDGNSPHRAQDPAPGPGGDL